MMNRYPLAALACAALVGGCGSEPLSVAEFDAQVHKICGDLSGRTEALEPADVGHFVDETKQILGELRDGFRGLKDRVPKNYSAGFSAGLSEIIDLTDQRIVTSGALKDVGTDRAKLAALTKELDSLAVQTDALFDKTGLTSCGR